ncbi:XTP/dITP diphosphatase [Natranaerofaba carboxydovora]|uniref:XTP/dITP diphosphatase n=1 Tax=Natranaerofaba carboxydovora TaxID=2742683 RepID=UPI001F13D7F7|nr:XTP/dITP diphosphatase [Natranaerofaba carboxydovora]UMZ72828.1 Non-canonical purine NTP pyrophosphatase [Natranaerofaba carboxydovora]
MKEETNKLVLASNNEGKIKELREILESLSLKDMEIYSLKDFDEIGEIEEYGDTFEENARIKAETVSQKTGLLALADDSGLEVDVLDGRPGVYSARYAGKDASDEENIKKLLGELKEVSFEDRKACFRCVIALSHPKIDTRFVEGRCDGYITEQKQGQQGFGYDPVFFCPAKDKSFGELEPEEKAVVSHRGLALKNLAPVLKETISNLRK